MRGQLLLDIEPPPLVTSCIDEAYREALAGRGVIYAPHPPDDAGWVGYAILVNANGRFEFGDVWTE